MCTELLPGCLENILSSLSAALAMLTPNRNKRMVTTATDLNLISITPPYELEARIGRTPSHHDALVAA